MSDVKSLNKKENKILIIVSIVVLSFFIYHSEFRPLPLGMDFDSVDSQISTYESLYNKQINPFYATLANKMESNELIDRKYITDLFNKYNYKYKIQFSKDGNSKILYVKEKKFDIDVLFDETNNNLYVLKFNDKTRYGASLEYKNYKDSPDHYGIHIFTTCKITL